VEAALHRIEALPGVGRYSVTFRTPEGAELSAVVQVNGLEVDVAPASLPTDWQPDGPAFTLLVDAVLAMDTARHTAKAPAELIDVPGGWDVMIGNVLLDGGIVTCAAHSAMRMNDAQEWVCPECGAKAIFATP
jgi:hypothetical protein